MNTQFSEYRKQCILCYIYIHSTIQVTHVYIHNYDVTIDT